MDDFRLLMISAMYENGGNLTHRTLDGHPDLYVYPFESQLGTRFVVDRLTSLFPNKYRWPEFPLGGNASDDYDSIIDEECKVRVRTPRVSKFKDFAMDLSDEERKKLFCAYIDRMGRSRGGNVEAFFRATFDAWHDCATSGRERVYVGYSPCIVVDTPRIAADVAGAHVLHVVRNPWSAYADTKRRPVPLPIDEYMLAWSVNQTCALAYTKAYPERVHVVRAEDVMADPRSALAETCRALEIEADEAMDAPTWNGRRLDEIRPWGTIRTPSPDENVETAKELARSEVERIAQLAEPHLDRFGYRDLLRELTR